MVDNLLSSVDWIIFTGVLFISVFIGLLFAIRDRKKQTTENYYFGERNLSPIPVAASVTVSYISAIFVIGLPVEVYMYGSVFLWHTLSQVVGTLGAVYLFIPFFHKLKLRTIYEYLELRYSRAVRIIASISMWIYLFFYLGVVIYVPSLALSAVTPVSLNAAIALTSVVCTFYTTIGGIRAVVWTDVLQAVVMLVGMVGMFIMTVSEAGGFDEAMKAADRGGRSNHWKFNFDPRIRSTFWTIVFGTSVNTLYMFGCDQVITQRYLSCKSVRTARIAIWLTLIPSCVLLLLTVGNGLALYSFFEGCDPTENGDIEKIDQSVPHLAAKVFHNAPGMSGLFVSAVYSGTLSSVSSGINAMSGLVLHDFILSWKKNLSQRVKVLVSVGLSVLFGSFVMLMAYLMSWSNSQIIQISLTITGCVSGPMLGIFVMGILMPWVNGKGALFGFISSWSLIGWISLSAMFSTGLYSPEPNRGILPVTADNCTMDVANTTARLFDINEATTQNMTTEPTTTSEGSGLDQTLFSISPFLFGAVALVACVILANIMSLATGCNRRSQMDKKSVVATSKLQHQTDKNVVAKIEVHEEPQ